MRGNKRPQGHFRIGDHQENRVSCRTSDSDATVSIHELYVFSARDAARNQLIFDDVLAALEAGRSPVVITERKDHLQTIVERSDEVREECHRPKGRNEARNGATPSIEALKSVPDSEERAIVATGRYLGEGFNDARLDTLFLTIPISWRGTLAQYAGRLHRLHATKREVVIYDYVDESEPMLAKMAAKREVGYRTLATKSLVRESCLPAILRGSRE